MSLPGSWELTEVPNNLFPVEILFRTEFSYFGSLWIWKPSLDHQMSVEHMVGNLLGTTEEVVNETDGSRLCGGFLSNGGSHTQSKHKE